MHTIRAINLEQDLPMLQAWWAAHKALPVPPDFLPQGWLISAGGVDIAAAFLYLDVGGKLAFTEYLTTNPAVAYSRLLVEDIKKLLDHNEGIARARGCKGILSLVVPGTGEDRMMRRMGYLAPDGPAHAMFCKRIAIEEGSPCQ